MKIVDELSFEEAMSELNQIVARLEGELPLGDSLTLFDRGQLLLNHCNRLLDSAKLRLIREEPEDLQEIT